MNTKVLNPGHTVCICRLTHRLPALEMFTPFSETQNLLTPYTHHPFLVRCAAQVNDRLIKENLMFLTVQTVILIQLEENFH